MLTGSPENRNLGVVSFLSLFCSEFSKLQKCINRMMKLLIRKANCWGGLHFRVRRLCWERRDVLSVGRDPRGLFTGKILFVEKLGHHDVPIAPCRQVIKFLSFSTKLYLALSLQFLNFGKRFSLNRFSGTPPCFWSPWGFIKSSWLTQPMTLEKAFWCSVLRDCTASAWAG